MENNGRGIFYGVIGVATLVVAIIGATFAFFSASAGTNEDIATGGATVGLTWDEETDKVLTDLIPMDVVGGAQISQFLTEVKSGDCVDTRGYNVCSVYQYTVGNKGSVAQDIAPTLNIGKFGFDKSPAAEGVTPTDNFHVAIFKGSMDKATTTDFTTTTALKDATDGALIYTHTFTAADGDSIALTELNEQLAAGTLDTDGVTRIATTATYTMVFWIEEAGHNQDYDQGDSFIGSMSYLTSAGEQITGSLIAG